ncbi:MAG: ParB/RepB/Spo0J family partition protein [Acidimicrobiales bacterium]
MARPQGGLGRGLEALIPASNQSGGALGNHPEDISDGRKGNSSSAQKVERLGAYVEIPVEEISVNQMQPRKAFDDEALKVLTESIQRFGVLQPVVVRASSGDKPFELVAGERRWRASCLAGKETIPAVIRSSNEETSLVEALVENLHREDLNPIEEAAAFQQLIDDFEVTHAELGQRLGKARTTISNSLRLLELSSDIQLGLIEGRITSGHARALLACESESDQLLLMERIVRDKLSVREVEQITRSATSNSKQRTQQNTVAPLSDASALEVEQHLSDYLNTTVSVQMSAKRGKLTINFATVSDLQRIYDLIYPGDDDTSRS